MSWSRSYTVMRAVSVLRRAFAAAEVPAATEPTTTILSGDEVFIGFLRSVRDRARTIANDPLRSIQRSLGHPRVQRRGDQDTQDPAHDLCREERQYRLRCDPGEGVAEDPPDRHGRVRERRRA